MKKVKLLFMSLLVFFASILVVNAEEKLVCDKNTVEVGKSITCSYTIGDEARMIETDSDYLKLDSVSGNGNTQQNDHQAIFQSSGKISFIAKLLIGKPLLSYSSVYIIDSPLSRYCI